MQACGFGTMLAGALFATWGYVHGGGLAPSSYLDAALAALAFLVPALFIAGLVGLYAGRGGRVSQLGEVGFVLGFVGSAAGAMRGLEDVIGWYDAHVLGYVNSTARGLLIDPRVDWLSLLLVGLSLVGIAALRTRTLGVISVLPLVMGASGWAYLFTDYGGVVETRAWHVAFGILFSLSWVALGSVLWYRGAAAGPGLRR